MGQERPKDDADLEMELRLALTTGLGPKNWGVGTQQDGTLVVFDRDTGVNHAEVVFKPLDPPNPDQQLLQGM